MKKYKIILLTFIALCSSIWGCDDILDKELRHSLSAEEAAQTEKGARLILSGALLATRSAFQSPNISVYRACGTDIVRSGTNLVDENPPSMPGMNEYSTALNATNEGITNIWDNYYGGILQANIAIAGITETPIEELSDVSKDQLGQAYTMRAYLYLELVRRFENILIAEVRNLDKDGPSNEGEQKSPSEVYQLIISDLETAIPLMLPRNSGEDRGVLVPSQGMAYLLLAEASLDIGEYQKAADAADALIADPSYALQDVDGVFGLNGGKTGEENNQEIIFSVGFSPDVPDEVQWTSQQFMPLYDRLNGVARTMESGGRPWSRLSPSQYYWDLFDSDGDGDILDEADGRLGAWHKTFWVFDDADNLPEGRNLGDTVTMEDAINQFGEGALQLRYIEPTTWKYAEDETYDRSTALAEGWRNIIMLRFSHAYIDAAEAYFMLGKEGEAMQYLNVLRERAFDGPSGNFSSITFEDIIEEQARELGQEGHRWAFLKRNDLLVERVGMYNPDASPNIQDKHVRWPIPLTFIDQTGSGQNPGY